MLTWVEKYILHPKVTDNFNLFVNLPALIQSYIDEGLLNFNKHKCAILREKVFDKIRIDGKWEILLEENTIEEGFIYYINEYPQIKEIYKEKGNIHILYDNSIHYITVFLDEQELTITKTFKMAYTVKAIPAKQLQKFSTSNDLTAYAKKVELVPLATKTFVVDSLAANVTAEEDKIATVATQLGNQILTAQGLEVVANQALQAAIDGAEATMATLYSGLNTKVTTLETNVTDINADVTAIGTTLDGAVVAIERIQDHFAV